jgi:hypothetical protein
LTPGQAGERRRRRLVHDVGQGSNCGCERHDSRRNEFIGAAAQLNSRFREDVGWRELLSRLVGVRHLPQRDDIGTLSNTSPQLQH